MMRESLRNLCSQYTLNDGCDKQDVTQDQFLSKVSQVKIQSFPSPRLVAISRWSTICP